MTRRIRMAPAKTEVDTRPKTLSVAGAAEYTGMSTSRIRELVTNGDIASKRDGRRIHVDRESLDLFLDSLPSA